MSKFVLEPLNDVNGKISFYKIIENTNCQWNLFCLEVEKDSTWEEQLDLLKSRMDEVANLKQLPRTKFKKLDPPLTDGYEVKTDNLRAYLLKDINGYIILHAGKKTTQESDIIKFKAIRKRYLAANDNDITRKIT